MNIARKGLVVALLATTIALWAHTLSSASSVYKQENAIKVSSSNNNLSFGTMLGAEGTYQSRNVVDIFILTQQKISVTFSAEPFEIDSFALSGKRPSLDVTYWVDHEGKSHWFAPQGSYLTINKESQLDAHQFSLRGEVRIKNIHEQPAGQYSGTILVTISGWAP